LGGLITALGCIPSGPKVSDTRIQANTYPFFQDTARNVSEAYPGRIRIRYVSDTDTPPPRSIRVTEAAANMHPGLRRIIKTGHVPAETSGSGPAAWPNEALAQGGFFFFIFKKN